MGRSRDRTSESYVTKSTTLERPSKSSLTASYDSQRDKRIDTTTSSLRSATLGRRSTADTTARSSVADRKRATSTKVASPNITSLNPATIQSLEKLERIKQRDLHRRPRTPEPESPKVTQTKLMMSPERLSRRKSLGNHPIGLIIGKLTCSTTPLPEEPEIAENNDSIVETKISITSPSAAKTVEEKLIAEKKDKKITTEKESDDISTTVEDTEAIKKENKDVSAITSPKEVTSDSKNEALGKTAAVETKEESVNKVELVPQKKEGISRTTSTPPKVTSPSNDRRSKYKSSTDNIFIHRTPVESVWGNFRTENATSSFRTKTKTDDSWRVKTPTSVSPLPSRRKCDTSPGTSRSNTPTSPPVRKPEDLKQQDNSLGSRSTTPTSPIVKDTEKPLSEGRSSPRQYVGCVVSSPLPKTEKVASVAKEAGPKLVVQNAKSPTPPRTTEVQVRTHLTTSAGRDYRRPKSRDSEAARALKIEQRKTPVLSPEALEALDSMLKCGIPEDTDSLETCVEEEEEITIKKSSLNIKSTEKKVSISSEPSVMIVAPTPNTETRPLLGEHRHTLSDRSKSLGTLCNERNSSPVCPEEGDFPSDAFMNSRLSSSSSRKGSFASRHSFSGMSTSYSMTDLSQIGKKTSKARRVGRSNSKRMIGRSAIDSYVADIRTSPSHRTPGSLAVTSLQSSSSHTLPTRVLGGPGIESTGKKTEKSRFRLFKK